MHGSHVSFSHHRTRRSFVLNVHKRHLVVDGKPRTVNICTRCMRTMLKSPEKIKI